MTRETDLQPGGETAHPAPPAPVASIELALAPADLPALSRLPDIRRAGASRPVNLLWHDTGDGALAADGLCLVRDGRVWRLERLRPGCAIDWPACAPPPALDEGASPAALHPTPPFDCGPVAAFEGKRRGWAMPNAALVVLNGNLRSIAAEQPTCRLTLSGPADTIAATAETLAAALRVSIPRATLALEAIAVARGSVPATRHLGAPEVAGGSSVSDGLAQVISHLLDVMLHWSDRCQLGTADRSEAEAVHQARVATRRLRSALSIYKHALPCPELDALAGALKECAGRFGTARDWDVFLAGTGVRLREIEAADPRVATLLRAAQRRRNTAHTELRAYLSSPAFRMLEVRLGCASSLRPWERTNDPVVLQRDTAGFATEVLQHRVRQVRRAGRDLDALPVPALHELRKKCKRLRYAAEFFAPGFPRRDARGFGKRLSTLQEELGALNDTHASTALIAQLGRAGSGFAGGIVHGWASAGAQPARARIGKAWKRFRDEPGFWHA